MKSARDFGRYVPISRHGADIYVELIWLLTLHQACSGLATERRGVEQDMRAKCMILCRVYSLRSGQCFVLTFLG